MVIKDLVSDSPDPIRLGGIGQVLESQLEKHLRSEIRTTILGHTQRGGTPTAFDRNLASAFGAYAAAMIADSQFGAMVALQENKLTSVTLKDVAEKVRTIPADAAMISTALAVGTSLGVKDFKQRFTGTRTSTPIT